MLKREWGAESNGKLLHLFIPSKTATLVLAFAVKKPALVPEFALGETTHDEDDDDDQACMKYSILYSRPQEVHNVSTVLEVHTVLQEHTWISNCAHG